MCIQASIPVVDVILGAAEHGLQNKGSQSDARCCRTRRRIHVCCCLHSPGPAWKIFAGSSRGLHFQHHRLDPLALSSWRTRCCRQPLLFQIPCLCPCLVASLPLVLGSSCHTSQEFDHTNFRQRCCRARDVVHSRLEVLQSTLTSKGATLF